MSDNPIQDCTVAELQRLLHARDLSATEVATSSLDKIEETQDDYNAFVSWDRATALQQAADLDARAARDDFAGPMHGIPVAAKDNYLTHDLPTRAGSLVEHPRVHSATDAVAVAELRSNGAVIIGKTNMHEWAYGATNEISSHGRTSNPWDPTRITGGSSGGSGAAVAARLVPAALGSDTGGSVRIPAAGCGISGIKPTFDLVDVAGILPLSWSFDVAGPMARTAADLAILLQAMSRQTTEVMIARVESARIGRLGGPGFESSPDVDRAVDAAIDEFVSHGATIDRLGVDDMKLGFDAWKVILHAEAASYHSDMLASQRDHYAKGVLTQLEAGRTISATDYLQAQRFRREFNNRIACLFNDVDVLALPTLPITAPVAGEHHVTIAGEQTTAQDAMTRLPWLANFTGLPALSVPCGFGDDGLPVALSLIGKPGTDFELLALGDAYQNTTDWHLTAPKSASHATLDGAL